MTSVKVSYFNYRPDGVNFVNGNESGVRETIPYVATSLTWHADLQFGGAYTGSRRTSEPGGFVVSVSGIGGAVSISGSMTTTLDGLTFSSPTN